MGKYTFEEFLQYASETGFDGVEISTAPGVHRNSMPLIFENITKIKGLLDKYNLEPFAVSGCNDLIHKDAEELSREIDKAENTCKLAREVSAKVVRVFGGEPQQGVDKKTP